MSHQDVSSWAGFAIMLALVIVILGPLFWSLHQAKKPLPFGNDGWVTTQRSIFDHVIGVIQIGFSILWLFFGVLAPFFLDEFNIGAILIFLLMLIMGYWFLQNFLIVYCAKIRFNDRKVEYKAFWRNISVYWNEVESISMGSNGPKISTAEGSFSISNTRRGFYQLLDMAREKGVDVQNSPYLKSPLTDAFHQKDKQ